MAKKLIIGREHECEVLEHCLASDRSELVIVYGRRRIGKTYLIEQYFEKRFDFWFVGVHKLGTREQLRRFAKTLCSYSGEKSYAFKSWFDAFDALKEYLSTLPANKKRVIFIDEMPWMDTGKSKFVVALEDFWNGWAMSQENIMLIATGSATSWMKEKLAGNKGGLHARVTRQLPISPFSLHEVEKYLEKLGMKWDRYQILQAYMILGGVPYYYSIMDSRRSLVQNIDELFFKEGGALRIEFDELYGALFQNADHYIKVTKCLKDSKSGLTFNEISKSVKLVGGKLTKILKNLEKCNFIEKWTQYGNKRKESRYRLIDFYTLFYYKFVEGNNTKEEQWWSKNIGSREIDSWFGNRFELVCMLHHRQIKAALGISGISTNVTAWYCKPDEENMTSGAQIDMIIERSDRFIHLCEMKFTANEYYISSDDEKTLRNRMGLFRHLKQCKKTLVNTFVTTYGVANNKHKSIVHSEVTMDDLFEF